MNEERFEIIKQLINNYVERQFDEQFFVYGFLESFETLNNFLTDYNVYKDFIFINYVIIEDLKSKFNNLTIKIFLKNNIIEEFEILLESVKLKEDEKKEYFPHKFSKTLENVE